MTVNYLKSLEILGDYNEPGSVISTGLNLDYQLTPVHRLSINATNVQSRGIQPFQEQQGTVQYSISF